LGFAVLGCARVIYSSSALSQKDCLPSPHSLWHTASTTTQVTTLSFGDIGAKFVHREFAAFAGASRANHGRLSTIPGVYTRCRRKEDTSCNALFAATRSILARSFARRVGKTLARALHYPPDGTLHSAPRVARPAARLNLYRVSLHRRLRTTQAQQVISPPQKFHARYHLQPGRRLHRLLESSAASTRASKRRRLGHHRPV
jgi:hypothetical protein